MAFLKLYFIALVAFFPLDMLWLGWIGRSFYRQQLGPLMREQTDWLAALLFYLLFLAGIIVFVVQPSLQGEARDVLLRGAFFGLVTYATYDLVNRAVINHFSWTLVMVDMLWGVVLCTTVSWVTWYFGLKV